LTWRNAKRAIGDYAAIETTDGSRWIVEPPHFEPSGNRIASYPRKPRSGLRKTLSAWIDLLGDYGSPELAQERPQAAVAAQILRSLAEAIERGDADANRHLRVLETAARRYL